jgi:hypothetical protein
MRSAVSAVVVGVVLAVGAAGATQPPPVIQDLGPVVPTPVPSPARADRIRLISSFTLQNKPDGDSIISFEATDFARSERPDYRIIATELYNLSGEAKPATRALRARILGKIRDLERDLLQYVEQEGPPREREPVTQQQGPQRP